MIKSVIAALAAFALGASLLAATPAKPKKKRHVGTTSSASTAKKTGTVVTTSLKTSARRKGKLARRPVRSYQQAPTPDRYKEIQQALTSKGYFKGESNGEWGPDSTEALKRFQNDQNLMPDGKINSLSLIALGLGPKRLTAKSSAPAPGATFEAAPPAAPALNTPSNAAPPAAASPTPAPPQ